jgi:alpha-1,2-mannosyltransferase
VSPQQTLTAGVERLSTGSWLTWPLMRFIAALVLAVLLVTSHGTVDIFNRPLGTDFSSFWTAGRMALRGEAPLAYDWAALSQFQKETHGVDSFFPWSYPPVFLILTAGLAALPYVPALLLWQSASLLAALAAFRAILPATRYLLFALAFPGVFICLGHGQTGFLTAALLGGGILALPRHEILAGVLFGLLVCKPQFGVLLPFVLIASGCWRAIVAAAATAFAAIAASLLIWGWPVWRAFFDSIPLTEHIVFETGDTGFEKFQSVFAWVRLCGGSLTLAYAAQAVIAIAALGACAWIWRCPVHYRLKAAALLVATLLVTPYVLDYDLIALGLALALLAAHAMEHGFLPWEKTLLAVAWMSPLCDRNIAKLTFFPLGFVVTSAIFAILLIRVLSEHRLSIATGRLSASGLRTA